MVLRKKFKLIVLMLIFFFYFFILRNSFLDNYLAQSELDKAENISTQELVLGNKTDESEEFMERMKRRMNERKQQIQKTCKKIGKFGDNVR